MKLHIRLSSFYNHSVASSTSQSLHLCHMWGWASSSNSYIASPTSQLILQPFCRFTYVTAHSTTLSLFHLHHRHLTYVTCEAEPHSLTLLSFHPRHRSFYNPSVASPMSVTSSTSPVRQGLILQPLHRFTYVIVHCTTLLSLHLRHISFHNPSVASPTSQALNLRHLESLPWHC